MGLIPRCAVILALAICGCSRSVYPVRGQVYFADGEPLVNGRVVIESADGKVGSWGQILPDGTFRMGTTTPSDGVPPGRWRILIEDAVTLPPPGQEGSFHPHPLIHRRFERFETSGLEFVVPDQLTWDIVVERR